MQQKFEPSTMNGFFMNVSDAGGAPTKRYFDIEEAKTEAARLCIKEGRRVHILQSVFAYDPPPAIGREDYKSALAPIVVP